jgi:hypothetical protein
VAPLVPLLRRRVIRLGDTGGEQQAEEEGQLGHCGRPEHREGEGGEEAQEGAGGGEQPVEEDREGGGGGAVVEAAGEGVGEEAEEGGDLGDRRLVGPEEQEHEISEGGED